MHLANLIQLWQSKLQEHGMDKAQAAQLAVAEMTEDQLYAVLPIISKLDHQVAMTESGWRKLPDHARMAIQYWLERTDTHQLMELRSADAARSNQALYPPLEDDPVDHDAIQQWLTSAENETFRAIMFNSDWGSWAIRNSLKEIARLRQKLAKRIGLE